MRPRPIHSRAYTMIEVMLAIAVMAVGAAGVMSMQRGSIVGDLESRRMDIATSVGRTWIERLRRDGTAWTGPNVYVCTPGGPCDVTLPFVSFGAPGVPSGLQGPGWYQPPIPTSYTAADGLSPMFDALGRDLIQTDAQYAVYCVMVKVDPIAQNGGYTNPPVSGTTAPLELVRATVMVFWPKQLNWATTAPTVCTSFAGGGLDPVQIETTHPGTYHLLFLSAPIMKNVL
jgi:prepilin-type N-terminal cleavage/methylation domain-containing protein